MTRNGTNQIWIRVIVERDGDGFMARCPGLQGCVTWASTQAELEQNVLDAVTVYLEGLKKMGKPIPFGPDVMFEEPQENTHSCLRKDEISDPTPFWENIPVPA